MNTKEHLEILKELTHLPFPVTYLKQTIHAYGFSHGKHSVAFRFTNCKKCNYVNILYIPYKNMYTMSFWIAKAGVYHALKDYYDLTNWTLYRTFKEYTGIAL